MDVNSFGDIESKRVRVNKRIIHVMDDDSVLIKQAEGLKIRLDVASKFTTQR